MRPWVARHALITLVAGLAGLGALIYFLHRKRPPEVHLPAWTPGDPGLPVDKWPTHSPGCAQSQLPSGRQARTVRVGDRDRKFELHIPRDHRPDRPLPLIFYFHGKHRTANTGRDRGVADLLVGAGDKAILAAPIGLTHVDDHFGPVESWDPRCDGPDVPFFDAMLADIETNLCINPRKVFATGLSAGADMTDGVACCRGDRLRAIAPASGGDMRDNQRCPTRRMPAFRLTHGGNEPYHPVLLQASVRFFREAHGCTEATAAVHPPPCLEYQGCAQPVVLCRYPDMGHTFPRDYGEATWGFFARFH
jgi:polyhydroxybutyrate depolymerase